MLIKIMPEPLSVCPRCNPYLPLDRFYVEDLGVCFSISRFVWHKCLHCLTLFLVINNIWMCTSIDAEAKGYPPPGKKKYEIFSLGSIHTVYCALRAFT